VAGLAFQELREAGAAVAASRALADAVKPSSASRRVKVFPMGVVMAYGPISRCGVAFDPVATALPAYRI
jgi:hypothetical protein